MVTDEPSPHDLDVSKGARGSSKGMRKIQDDVSHGHG